MTKIAKGKPRSLPDPAAEPYDDLARKHLPSQGAKTPLPALAAATFPPIDSRLALLNRAARPNPYVTIGGRTYKGSDNGRANVLVPIGDLLLSPAEFANRQRMARRAMFMANNPLGSAAYAIATLAKRSPQARDGALMVGSVVDAAMMGATSRLALVPRMPTSRRPVLAPPLVKQPEVRHGRPTSLGQAAGLVATLTSSTVDSGTKANRRQTPPGWQGNGRTHNQARGHLHAKQLGGSGRGPLDLVTLTQNPTNSSLMARFENEMKRRVLAGEVIEYTAMPLYNPGVLPPARVLLAALGTRGAPVARIVENPAGKKRE